MPAASAGTEGGTGTTAISGLWGGRGGPGYMGLVATMGYLWVLQYPYCYQMTTQIHPMGDMKVSGKL